MGRVAIRSRALFGVLALLLTLVTSPTTAAAASPGPAATKVSAPAASPKPKVTPRKAYPARELGPEQAKGRPKISAAPTGRIRTALSAPWTSLGPQPITGVDTYGMSSGRVTSLAVDPTSSGKTLYAGTAGGGVWKTTDGGLNWAPMSDNQVTLGIGAIAVDPNNPGIVYAGTGEGNRCGDCLLGYGLLQTKDGGATWTLLGQALAGHYSNAIVVDRLNSNHVVVASSAGIYDSFDATYWGLNSSFASLSTLSQPRVDSLFQDASSPNVWWASVNERCRADGFIARSTDGARTWSVVRRMSSFSGFPQATRLAMAEGPGGVLYAQMAACRNGSYLYGQLVAILKSTDSGATWTVISSAPGLIDYFNVQGLQQGWYDNTIAVDPTNANHVVFGGVTMLATRDGGASFADVAQPYSGGPVHADFHAVAFTGPDALYTGNDGGIWKTPDLGSHWSNLNSTLAITTFFGGAAVDSTHFIGGAQDDGTAARFPGGPTPPAWSEVVDGDGTFAQIVPGSSTYYAAQPFGTIIRGDYTTPGVFRLASPCDNSAATQACLDPASFVAPFAIDPSSSPAATTIYAATNRIYRSTSGGIPAGSSGWTAISGDLTTGLGIFTTPDTISAIAVGPNGTVVTGSWGGAIYESTNANSPNPTWTSIQNTGLPYFNANQYFGRPWITSVAVTSSGAIFAGLGNGSGVFVGGIPVLPNMPYWTSLGAPSNTFIDSLAADPRNPQVVYAGTDAGAFQCLNCGPFNLPVANWQALGSGLPNSPIDQITVALDKNEIVAWTHGRGAWTMSNPNAPTLIINPNPVDFGSVYPNSRPALMAVTAVAPFNGPNVSWQRVTISGANATDYAIASNTCTGASTYCGVNVALTASASGTRTATLNFYDDAPGSPQTVPLTAYVTPANISFTSNPLNLGSTTVGVTSSPVTLTINSTGTGPLTLGTLSLMEVDGQNVAIVGGSDQCSGQTVAAGGSCTVKLSMSPVYTGGVAAMLRLPDNAGGGIQFVTITGMSNGVSVGSPTTFFDFGGMNVGAASTARNLGRTAYGNQDLIVTAVSIGGTNPSNFTITSQNCTTGPVHPGQSCNVMVTFTADALASRTATLTFTDNAINEKTTTLIGHGVNTTATVSYSSIEFNTVTIGAFGAVDVGLVNNGPDALTFEGFAIAGSNAGDFSIGYSACNGGSTLITGGGCDFIIDFRPTAIGTPSRSGTLTIYDSTGVHAIALHGTATGPSFVFSTSPLNFGTATAGSPVTQSETITNGGDAAFTINAFGNQCCFNDYSVATDNCSGVSVAPNASCSVTFRFDPWASGDRSAFIRVFANNNTISGSLSVTGMGIAPLPSAPATVFPDTAVTYSSAPVTINVTNNGQAAWNVGTVTTGSPNYGIVGGSDQCSGTTVNPGSSCSLQVVFAPKSLSNQSGVLTSSGNFHYGFASLGGNPLSPSVQSQSPASFGSLETGASTQQSIQIVNRGSSNLHATGATFTSGAYSLGPQSCQNVAPQGQCSLVVVFAPATAGQFNAQMTLIDDEAQPFTWQLSGAGLAPSACTGAAVASNPSVPGSAGTQVVFTATASGCPRPVYSFYLTVPGGSPVLKQPYSEQSTWGWDTSGLPNGSYLVTVRARDFPSSAAQEATTGIPFQITTPACTSTTVTADHSGPQPPGASVTFTAARPNCVDPATYQFWIIGNGLPWTIVQPFSTNASWTVDYSRFNGAGTYTIDVWVKEPGSSNAYDFFGLASFVIGGCSSASIAPNSGNAAFMVSAAGSACTSPEFEYWIYAPGRGWFIAAPWTSTSTFDAGKLNLAPGTYSLDVWARQKGVSTDPGYFQTWGLSTIVITGGACGGTTLAPAQSSPATVGATVQFTATAGSCGSPQYEYWLYPGAGGGWQLLQAYSSSPSYTLNASALGLKERTYSIVAWLKQPATSPSTYDTFALFSFTFGGCDSAGLTSDLPSPQPLGRTVTFTTACNGAAASSAEFEYWGLAPGGSWILLQPWSSNPTAKVGTLYAPYGDLAIVVYVRAAGTNPPLGYETYDLVSFALTG